MLHKNVGHTLGVILSDLSSAVYECVMGLSRDFPPLEGAICIGQKLNQVLCIISVPLGLTAFKKGIPKIEFHCRA